MGLQRGPEADFTPPPRAAAVEGGLSGPDALMADATNNSVLAEPADGQPPDETDHANYFCEYAYLYHQMDMLEDNHRTGSYYAAIDRNRACFEDKVVLDVGSGSGILSIMAARAGAKQVFAVEATDMAMRCRKIVEANGLSNVIKVLQGTVETIELPCKVDVIVSEWMGYFLLRESMLDSVLIARDRHLKPTGSLWPSHATLYLAPLGQCKALRDKLTTWEGERQHWNNFENEMKTWYQTDFSCVEEDFMREQRKYYLQTAAFGTLTPKHLAGPGRPLLEMDLKTVTIEGLKAPSSPCICTMRVAKDGPLEGFVGYFDTVFRGCDESPAIEEHTLSTAPKTTGTTHWGQQLFGFYPPLQAKRGDSLEISLYIRRQERNHRLLRLEAKIVHFTQAAGQTERTVKEEREETYYID